MTAAQSDQPPRPPTPLADEILQSGLTPARVQFLRAVRIRVTGDVLEQLAAECGEDAESWEQATLWGVPLVVDAGVDGWKVETEPDFVPQYVP